MNSYRWMDGLMNGCMDRWIDECGCMNGWKDGATVAAVTDSHTDVDRCDTGRGSHCNDR